MVLALHAGSRGFDSHRGHMSERFFRSNRPEYPHPVSSELEHSGIRVAVGDCSVTECWRWHPPYQTGKTVHVHAKHYKHNEDGCTAPGVCGNGSVPLSRLGNVVTRIGIHTHIHGWMHGTCTIPLRFWGNIIMRMGTQQQQQIIQNILMKICSYVYKGDTVCHLSTYENYCSDSPAQWTPQPTPLLALYHCPAPCPTPPSHPPTKKKSLIWISLSSYQCPHVTRELKIRAIYDVF